MKSYLFVDESMFNWFGFLINTERKQENVFHLAKPRNQLMIRRCKTASGVSSFRFMMHSNLTIFNHNALSKLCNIYFKNYFNINFPFILRMQDS